MKKIYLIISKNRNAFLFRYLSRVVRFLYFALENKNNDHSTNGEFWLMKELSKWKTEVVFDVGANIGKWSLAAQRIFKNCKIYAFEPMPEVFLNLKENLSDKPQIVALNCALFNERKTLAFNYYPNSILFSSIYEHYNGGDSRRIEVPAIDGDSFCKENHIDEIDFLKIDAEGSEHFILEGFRRKLEVQKIKVIQFEYGIFSITSKFLLKDYYDFFSKYGYILGKIYPNHILFTPYHWTLENFIGPNYVAIRSSEIDLIKSLGYTA